MRTRMLSVTCAALFFPAALFATASPGSGARHALPSVAPTLPLAPNSVAVDRGDWRADADPRCGRGRAWGCRRDRGDDRYDRRADRWERDRWERERYERARWEQARWERAQYRARFDDDDRRYERYERYDGYAVACLRAGGRVLGAVLVVCVP